MIAIYPDYKEYKLLVQMRLERSHWDSHDKLTVIRSWHQLTERFLLHITYIQFHICQHRKFHKTNYLYHH